MTHTFKYAESTALVYLEMQQWAKRFNIINQQINDNKSPK